MHRVFDCLSRTIASICRENMWRRQAAFKSSKFSFWMDLQTSLQSWMIFFVVCAENSPQITFWLSTCLVLITIAPWVTASSNSSFDTDHWTKMLSGGTQIRWCAEPYWFRMGFNALKGRARAPAAPRHNWSVYLQIVAGLAYLHRHGLTHGDLKVEWIWKCCIRKLVSDLKLCLIITLLSGQRIKLQKHLSCFHKTFSV